MRRLTPLLILLAFGCDDGGDLSDDAGLQLGPIQWGGGEDEQEGGGGLPPKPGTGGDETPEPGDPGAPEDAPQVVEPDPPEVVREADGGASIAIVDAATPPPDDNGGGGGGGSGCGDLTYEGLCDGATARWCDREGRRRSEDCGADGCGWVNAEIGYFCGGSGDGPGGGGDTPDTPNPPPPPPDDNGACGTPVETAVTVLANQARAQNGARQLACDAAGTRAARAHSQDMCDNDYFSHTGRDGSSAGDRMRRAGAQFGGWGENIAWGQRDANAVHSTWMNSSGHRRNILGNGYGRIGVGLAVCGGRNYWTQVFLD